MRRRPLTRMEREDLWRDLGAAAFVAGVVVLVYWLVPPEAGYAAAAITPPPRHTSPS